MNDEIKNKIEEILYKADAFNFAETSEKLTTLYTEMVEEELEGFVEFFEKRNGLLPEKDWYPQPKPNWLQIMINETAKEYLSQTNKQEETK